MAMTPAELANVVALPLSGVAWMGVQELTPSQLSSILTAIAAAGQTNHIQTGGATPTATYQAPDGGAIDSIAGTDSAGRVLFTLGTGIITRTRLLTVTFAAGFSSFTNAPAVVLTVEGDDTGLTGLSVTPTQAGFDVYVQTATNLKQYEIDWIAAGAPN